MAHHYYCWMCGNHIDFSQSFCANIRPTSKKEEANFLKQAEGGYGYGTCTECDWYDDEDDSYKGFKKEQMS